MIIYYKVLFPKNRTVARICSKSIQFIKRPYVLRKELKHLSNSQIDYRDIPVVINNYNRISHLLKLIDWLEKAEMQNIYIIDNASTYQPLLDYYNTTKHNVIKLNANLGYKAFWDTSIHLWFKGLPYIYTDPDVVPIEECPADAVRFLQEILNMYKKINKVGFGLKIDDIPDFYQNKLAVIEWEKKYWEQPVAKDLYKADIDTTFALYRSNSVKQQWGKTFRTGGKYLARHLPWYENPDSLSEEEIFYRKGSICSTWCPKSEMA